MSEGFVGEIRMFAGNFAPRSWAFCDGQLLAVSQNEPLFSLLGTIYGGDGRTTFGLPDLRGRVPVHEGDGPGLPSIPIGRKAGQERITLTANQAGHDHALNGSDAFAGDGSPAGNVPAKPSGTNIYSGSTDNIVAMHDDAVQPAGGSQSHNNLMPYLCINFIICLFGVYPSRS